MAALTAYVRQSVGSDNNGGSSNTASPDKTGTGGTTAGTTTFVDLAGTFAAGDVDKLVHIITKGRYRIVGFSSSTTVTLSGSPSAGSGLTWNIGGATAGIKTLVENSSTAFLGGDTIYMGSGVYRVTVILDINVSSELFIIGDVDGSKTGEAPGEIQWTAYTADKTAPPPTVLINTNGKDFLTFKNITFVGGNANTVTASSSTDIKFTDCTFINGFTAAQVFVIISVVTTFGVVLNWTIDRCRFLNGSRTIISITLPTGVGADYDVNFVIKNCLVFTGNGTFVLVGTSGTSANEGGGVDVLNCTLIGNGNLLATGSTRNSLTFPCTVTNCFVFSGNTAINSAESGAITENYNLLIAGATPRALTATGTNSVSDGSYAPLLFIGQELQVGANLRPMFMPAGTGSPLLGFGNNSSAPSVDILNRIRPAGGSTGTAVGAYEYHDSAIKETSTIRSGSNAIKIAGPGDHEFVVPVNNASTTITVYVQFNGSYAGTKPQMQVVNGTEIGVADATATAVGSSGSWEQLSLNFTPTAKGVVTIRLISNSTVAAGSAFFDDFAIA